MSPPKRTREEFNYLIQAVQDGCFPHAEVERLVRERTGLPALALEGGYPLESDDAFVERLHKKLVSGK